MITDQKKQNRLHADTGTELFSIRQRKEAVTRMLDILKETPEYLQVMNHIPAYAMDDDTSEWWNSEESENFMNSLLEVMESYTPDGYRFGPKSGTTDLTATGKARPDGQPSSICFSVWKADMNGEKVFPMRKRTHSTRK